MTTGYLAYLERVESEVQGARSPDVLVAIEAAAQKMADAIAAGRVIYGFGASHAGLLVQDQVYRAGGLAAIQPILPRELMLDAKPIQSTTQIEQTLGTGPAYLEPYSLDDQDVVLVASVSGRNPVPVQLAMTAKAAGACVIALTSLAYTRAVTGRGGVPLLADVADVVLDLGGVPGDASVFLGEGLPAAGPTSSPVGTAMLHGLSVEVAQRLRDRGIQPPVFASANLDDAAAWNDTVVAQYQDRVDYLGPDDVPSGRDTASWPR